MAQGLQNTRRGPAEARPGSKPTAFGPLRAGWIPVFAAVLLLAGCAARPVPVAETAAIAPAPVPESVTAPAPDAPAGAAPDLAKPARPEDVLGLAAAAIEKLLGRPELVRRDAPAEVWQYRSESCVVDLYLYREKSDYRVAFIEARDRSAAGMTPERCFDSLARPSI